MLRSWTGGRVGRNEPSLVVLVVLVVLVELVELLRPLVLLLRAVTLGTTGNGNPNDNAGVGVLRVR